MLRATIKPDMSFGWREHAPLGAEGLDGVAVLSV
jgi:hypothetical protein